MPRKGKRANQLRISAERARKGLRIEQQASCSVSSTQFRNKSLSTEPTDEDPTFDPADELSSNPNVKLEQYIEDWLCSLDREDTVSLGIFLAFQLEHLLNFTATKAAEHAAIMIGKSERTVRSWRSDFMEHGEIPENKQGRYQRRGILWSNEALNKKATIYVRANANVKGQPNLTASSFCSWVNEELLPNELLEPGFPRKIGVDTARLWLHHLGFEVLSARKGAYFDGHEGADVVQARKSFLNDMIEVGFLHPEHAPNEEAQRAFPKDIPLASNETRSKTVLIFHDESTFNANDDQTTQWGKKGEGMLRPKSKGSGIMVSDFVDQINGYLALTDDEFEEANAKDLTITQKARQTLEYGESREGYWSCDKFMLQIEVAVKIANIKYPKSEGWNVVWIFDHSSCHTAMAEDALDVAKMNVKPGGKQPRMHDTIWGGEVQKMNYSLEIPKGMKQILEE